MALLMVIAVVTLLVGIVIGLRVSSEATWDENSLSRLKFQAHLLAESGANIALHPDIKPGDPALQKDFEDGRSYQVKIKTEGGRILVNNLANKATVVAVTELFTLWGLDAGNAAIAAESLADWIDTNSEARTNGAEQPYYASFEHPQFPTNQPFSNLESMLLVRGMDEVARIQPLWQDFFTIYGDGLIDLNFAPAEVIEAFLSVPRDSALNFISARKGADGIADTFDDELITADSKARQLLGITSEHWSEKSALITLAGTMRRIESIGQVGDYQVRLILLSDTTQGEGELASPVARYSE